MEEMLTAVGCLLLTVTVFAGLVVVTAWFPKPRLVGVTVTGTTPFPVSATVCGLLMAPSVNVKVPERVPVVVGANVTLTVQVAPAASELEHVLVCE